MSTSVTDHSINKILGFDLEQPKKRQRRNRTIFSDDTIALLETTFSENKYPDIKERLEIAKQIGEEEARVQVWFQNRRARHRRSRRPRSSSDGASSTSSSPKSSPSPPPVAALKPTWLYTFNSDTAEESASHSNGQCGLASPSFKNLTSSLPQLISPLPKTPARKQRHGNKRRQFSLWSPLTSPSYSNVISSPPRAISPLPPTPTYNVLRLPLTTQLATSSVSELRQSEVRQSDGKLFFSYQTSI